MEAKIRKPVRYVEDIAIQSGCETAAPVRTIAAAAVIKSARAKLGFVEN